MAQTWKQPRSPSVSEWINKLWCTQTIEYYSGLKRNELSSHERTWRNFKCMLLSERSQSETSAYPMTPSIQLPGKGKTMETVKKISDCQGMGRGSNEQAEDRGFLWQ